MLVNPPFKHFTLALGTHYFKSESLWHYFGVKVAKTVAGSYHLVRLSVDVPYQRFIVIFCGFQEGVKRVNKHPGCWEGSVEGGMKT